MDHKESWALKNWCFWTVVLKKILKSLLDYKEIKPVHPKGNQSWIFIGRTDAEAETPILWPPDEKNWLIRKDPEAGKVEAWEEGDDRGWDGWLTSLTQWSWVWASSQGWWWTGKPSVLQFMGLQKVRRLSNWTEYPDLYFTHRSESFLSWNISIWYSVTSFCVLFQGIMPHK